jgi:glycosyltransferase involved in cell wall biosynthesis
MSSLSKSISISAIKYLPNGRSIFNKMFDLSLKNVINNFKPDIIHAHTPWFTALPALNRAKLEGIPFVYEMRGLWEESELAEGIITEDSKAYRLYRENDNHILARADHVIAISAGLRDGIIRRAVTKNEITIVPNGVDNLKFTHKPPDTNLVASLDLTGKVVIGYISSLRKLEGINTLLDAMPQVDSRGTVLIIGDGPERGALEQHSNRLGITDRVHFLGNISHEDITRYYSIIDIFVVPRIDAKVCHLVTPLKPLEAMAMGKCVLASNVGGLRELIDNEKTGILFKAEDVKNLSSQLNSLIQDENRRAIIGKNAMNYIAENRTWKNVCSRYNDIYKI